jgi:hypothetical protein
LFRILLGASTLIVCLASTGCAEQVDSKPAIAVVDSFYKSIGPKHPFARLDRFYSREFAQQAPDWPTSLDRIERAAGPVTAAALVSAQMAAKDDHPCFLLDYEVSRPAGKIAERLFVCRDAAAGSAWHIVGHGMRRMDNGSILEAGVLPVQSCVGTHCPQG